MYLLITMISHQLAKQFLQQNQPWNGEVSGYRNHLVLVSGLV